MSKNDDALFAAMGRVAIFSSELDDSISYAIQRLINEEVKFTRIITTELSFNNKIFLLLNLYRARHNEDEDYDILKKITNRSQTAQDKRNIIVHSLWKASTPEVVTQVKSIAKSKGYKTNIKNWSLNDFNETWKEFKQLKFELEEFIFKLMESGKAFKTPGI